MGKARARCKPVERLRTRARRLSERPKQQRLRLAVRLVGAVKVEVLVRDVGDHGHVERAAGDPVLGQPVRGGLQDGNLGAGVAHLGQVALDVGRVGRGGVQTRVVDLLADDGVHRADQTHAARGRFEDVEQQIRRSGFAVRAGDAHERHAAAGMTVPRRAQPGQRRPAVRHPDVRRPAGPPASVRRRWPRPRARSHPG